MWCATSFKFTAQVFYRLRRYCRYGNRHLEESFLSFFGVKTISSMAWPETVSACAADWIYQLLLTIRAPAFRAIAPNSRRPTFGFERGLVN